MSTLEYFTLRGIVDKLDVHQPLVTDLWMLKRYCEGQAMSKFLSGLDPSLVTHIRSHILDGNNVPSLSTAYSKVLHVSTGFKPTAGHISHIEHSAMIARHDRGRGRGHEHDSRGCGFSSGHGFSWSVSVLTVRGRTMCLRNIG